MNNELRQLDFQIAEQVMGWQRQPNYNYWMTFPAGGSFKLHGHIATWKPTIDITAAMDVVKHLWNQGIQTEIYFFLPSVRPLRVEMLSISGTTGEECISFDELPTAICRAALAAVKEQKSGEVA